MMKYIRELKKISDIRIVIDDVSRKTKEHSDENNTLNNKNHKNEIISNNNNNNYNNSKNSPYNVNTLNEKLKSINDNIKAISTDLFSSITTTNSLTGPPGGMEIILQNSEIDDETLFGIINLLKENSLNSENISDKNDKNNISNVNNMNDKNNNLNNVNNVPKKSLQNVPENDSKNVPQNDLKNVPENAPPLCSLLARLTVSGVQYLNRILLLNLKGNNLTDLSCKVSSKITLRFKINFSLVFLDLFFYNFCWFFISRPNFSFL